MTTQNLIFGRDVQGMNAYAPQPSTLKFSASIVANVATSFIVPSTYKVWVASFRYAPNDVYVDVSGSDAATPLGSTFAETTSELNPASLTLLSGTKVSVISSQTTTDVSVVLWPVSYP